MWNKEKIQGILLGLTGVLLARLDVFIGLEQQMLYMFKAAGVLLTFLGIARYVMGIPHTKRQVKNCPGCYTKNDIDATVCEKCKKPLS